jgi:hypothetical protein
MLNVKIHNVLRISLVMLLSMGIFTTGLAANADCVKMCCRDSAAGNFDSVTEDGANHMSFGCCSGIQENPCGLPKSQVADFPKYTTAGRTDTNTSYSILFILEGRLSDSCFNRVLGLRYDTTVPTRSSPVYLENLALLC